MYIHDAMSRWTRPLLILASVLLQLPCIIAPDTPIELAIEKVSKVMRDDDPTGRKHNTKVVIAPHDPLYGVDEWKLILDTTEGGTLTLHLPADGNDPSIQTEFTFQGHLPNSKSIFLQAKNSVGVIAMDYLGLPIEDLHSTIAWVGESKASPLSSMRVAVSKLVGKVTVGDQTCSSSESPCYFINPSQRPTHVERCVEASLGSSKTVKLCDERETSYQEMLQPPSLFLRGDGTMEIEIPADDRDDFSTEVVAYDPEDRKNIFSNSSYKCYSQIDKDRAADGKLRCLHSLSLPEGQLEIMVLVVQIDVDGYVCGSDLQIFRGNRSNTDSASILVASFIGTMIALAIIILLAMFFVRIRQTRRRKREERQGSQARYTQTPTDSTEP